MADDQFKLTPTGVPPAKPQAPPPHFWGGSLLIALIVGLAVYAPLAWLANHGYPSLMGLSRVVFGIWGITMLGLGLMRMKKLEKLEKQARDRN